MTRDRRFPLVALLLACLAGPASAQDDSVPGPVATLRRFWDANAAKDWIAAAQLLSPSAVDALRRQRLNQAALNGRPPDFTVETLMRLEPEMPRAVAEWQVERVRRARAASIAGPFPEFLGVDSLVQLGRMSTIETAVSWLRAGDPFERMIDDMARRGCPMPEGLRSAVPPRPVRIYGVVYPDSLRALVVFERFLTSQPSSPPGDLVPLGGARIAHLDRTADGWRILPRQDLLDLMGLGSGQPCLARPK